MPRSLRLAYRLFVSLESRGPSHARSDRMRVASALGLLCCTACVTPAVRSASTAAAVPVRSGEATEAEEMSRTLSVELEPRGTTTRETLALPPSYARGKLRVELRKDGSVEYRLPSGIFGAGGINPEKFDSTEKKIGPLIDNLFARAN